VVTARVFWYIERMGNPEHGPSFFPEAEAERSQEQREFADRLEADPNLFIVFRDSLDLVLVSEGEKPASHIDFWKIPEESEEEFQRKVNQLTALLEARGLSFHTERKTVEGRDGNPVERVGFSVGRSEEELQKFTDADQIEDYDERMVAYGRALGYPETAVEAKPDELIKWYELPDNVVFNEEVHSSPFGMSREHWQEEIETAREWASVAKEAAPRLYEQATNQILRDRLLYALSETPEELRRIFRSQEARAALEQRNKPLYDNFMRGARANGIID